MSNSDDCPNTNRLLDWMGHCKVQHEELNRLLREIHAALHGNGTEGLKSRVSRHSQQITHVEREVVSLRTDVDERFEDLRKSIGQLNIRFWRMAIIVATLVVGVNKGLQMLDVKSIIGL